MHDSQHTAVKLQWLTTINDNNAFETLSTVISALALQHAACNLTWQPAGPARGKLHIATLTDHFRQHHWRCGRPVPPSPERCFTSESGSLRKQCFADSRIVHSFQFHSGRASDAYLAVRSLRRAAFRWLAVPAPAAPAHPQALLLQRRPRILRRAQRVVHNEAEVLGALRAAGFDARAFTPERMPLAELLALMRRSSLLVCVHGAGMINQIFMPPARAAVVEAFLPSQGYNTGAHLSHILGFQHLKLFLRWEDIDDAPLRSAAAFNATSFFKRRWTQSDLRGWIRRCAADGERSSNLMTGRSSMCSVVKKCVDYALNTKHVAYLARTGRAFLQRNAAAASALGPAPEEWLEPALAPPAAAVIAAAGAGCAGSAVNSVAVEARLLDGVGVIDARGMVRRPRPLCYGLWRDS